MYDTAMLKITLCVIVSPFYPRGCTDIICCVLFMVVILGYMAVGILGKMCLLRTSHFSDLISLTHTNLLILYDNYYFSRAIRWNLIPDVISLWLSPSLWLLRPFWNSGVLTITPYVNVVLAGGKHSLAKQNNSDIITLVPSSIPTDCQNTTHKWEQNSIIESALKT
jgi:hypothetical protein